MHDPPHLSMAPSARLAQAPLCSATRCMVPWKVRETIMLQDSYQEGWAGVDRKDSQDEVVSMDSYPQTHSAPHWWGSSSGKLSESWCLHRRAHSPFLPRPGILPFCSSPSQQIQFWWRRTWSEGKRVDKGFNKKLLLCEFFMPTVLKSRVCKRQSPPNPIWQSNLGSSWDVSMASWLELSSRSQDFSLVNLS